MKVSGEAYSQRLKEYSDATIRLILSFTDRERAVRASEIAADSELTEEQVVAELLKLKEGK